MYFRLPTVALLLVALLTVSICVKVAESGRKKLQKKACSYKSEHTSSLNGADDGCKQKCTDNWNTPTRTGRYRVDTINGWTAECFCEYCD